MVEGRFAVGCSRWSELLALLFELASGSLGAEVATIKPQLKAAEWIEIFQSPFSFRVFWPANPCPTTVYAMRSPNSLALYQQPPAPPTAASSLASSVPFSPRGLPPSFLCNPLSAIKAQRRKSTCPASSN